MTKLYVTSASSFPRAINTPIKRKYKNKKTLLIYEQVNAQMFKHPTIT